jgi:hypothetical protein
MQVHYDRRNARVSNCGGLPVEFSLPEGEHDDYFQNKLNYINKGFCNHDAEFLSNMDEVVDFLRQANKVQQTHIDMITKSN